MLKVWLREPHHTDNEAIKLVVDETMDVSDVLLKVPELLRVQHLKPSEIQAEYKDVVISNRLLVSDIFEGAKEGTFVIRPRPGVVVPKEVSRGVSVAHGSRGGDVKRGIFLDNSKKHPLPPPSGRNMASRSPRVSSESLRRPISLSEDCGKPPIIRSLSQKPISARSNGGGITPKNRTSSFGGSLKEKRTPSRATTPKRDVSSARSDERLWLRSRHTDPNFVRSRFRQEAEKAKAPSKRAQTSAVCDSFKPQWGKPLCATCNHPKHSHWISQRIKASVVDLDGSSEVNGTLSDVGRMHRTSPSEKVTTLVGNNHSDIVIKDDAPCLEQSGC